MYLYELLLMNRFEISDAEKLDWTGTINNVNRFSTIPNVVSGLRVKSNTCNEEISTVDLSRFDFVKKVEVGSNSLQHAQQLLMNGLNRLTSFEIGEGSFNQSKTVNIGSNSLNAMAELSLHTFQSLNEVSIGEGSMNAVESVNASGLTGLTQFIVNHNSLEETTE